MKIELENTDKIVMLVVGGREVPARIWQGVMKGEGGDIPIHCYITRVAVKEGMPEEAYTDFEKGLNQTAKMRPDILPIPLRLIL